MFDLAYPLVETTEIDGVEYKLNLSFDNVLRLIDMLGDKDLSDMEQIELGLMMLLGEGIELDLDISQKEEVFYQLFQETIGKEVEDAIPTDIEGNPMPQQENDKTYDLKQDAEYIFASFYSDYGIDLFEMQGKLHWKKFKALLGGLTDGSKFLRVIEIRTMELPKGKGSEKQKKHIQELKEHYALKGDD